MSIRFVSLFVLVSKFCLVRFKISMETHRYTYRKTDRQTGEGRMPDTQTASTDYF